MSIYTPHNDRHDSMDYKRCGNHGLKLPTLSLGLWQNFGEVDDFTIARSLLHTALDHGINHFDLANNYGPPPGSAEITFGKVFKADFSPYRDELIISSKAGYGMWAGPHGSGGSRKHLIASCDQSLMRTGLEYFDIFYHHCMDPDTPLEETMQALDHIVRSGKALYVGVSNYNPESTKEAVKILKSLNTPLVIHQPRYNLLDREFEKGVSQEILNQGLGGIAYSPLAQGLLTNKYLKGIPATSRAANQNSLYLNSQDIDECLIEKIQQLNELANSRNQTLAQMAIAWVLNNPAITSCIIGASRVDQLRDSVNALRRLDFTDNELETIDRIVL